MKRKIITLALALLFAVPCTLLAEEVEIQLMEVISMNPLPGGDGPLDNPEQSRPEPTRPTSFRATINGNSLSINKLESSIPSAQATVVNVSTGNIVLNQQFTTSLLQQISSQGTYVLHIQTTGGALVGQFIVQ